MGEVCLLAQYITLIFALSCGLCTVTSVLSPQCNERRVHCIPCTPQEHCRSVRHSYGSEEGKILSQSARFSTNISEPGS